MENKEIYLNIFDEVAPTIENDDFFEEELDENLSDIAIVGMAVKTGKCQNSQELWEALSAGEELIRDFPAWRGEDVKAFCDWVGRGDEKFGRQSFLENIDLFSPEFFQILPKDASLIDPAQRMFLMTAWSALEDACMSAKSLNGTDTGVFVGYTPSTDNYSEMLSQSNPEYEDRAIPGKVNSVIASRLSYWLNLRGPAVMVDTACSSSLSAVHVACNAIRQGDCKQAIVGSVKIDLMPLVGKGENNVSVLSKDGSTRTFDINANGSNPGEGVIALILKPLSDAEKDKDRIYAVIKGSALNQDGASVGITAPNADAQEAVIVKAWENARINPEQVSYIETHGTATKLGDPVEITALSRAFQRYTDKKQFCAVGSVKANLGHLDCASGIMGLVKCVLELKNKVLLQQINFTSPNKEIDFISSAVYVNEKQTFWESDGPRICGVSSFGMSGTNCHVILQEYENDIESDECFPLALPLSARNKDDLVKTAELFSDWVKEGKANVSDCIYAAALGKSDYDVRAAVVIESVDDLDNLSEKVREIISNNQYDSDLDLDEEANNKVCEMTQEGKFDYEDFQDICKLYNSGADVDWERLYESFPVTKTSLPGYPMKLQRCWEVPKNKEKKYYKDVDEQLIDTCLVASPQIYVFATHMNEETHTEVKEHIIGDKHVLAGTVYVEMLHCAAKHVLKTEKMQVNNLIFMNPMIFEEGQTREVNTILYLKSEDKYDVTIQSKPVECDDDWEIHAQGQVELLPEEFVNPPENVDIPNVISTMNSMPLNDENSSVEQMVTTGPRWRVNKALWVGEEDAVTMAAIEKEFSEEIDWYYLYPSMLDAAVNCSSALNGNDFCLPYYYGTLRIYGKMPKQIYSHTVKNMASSSPDGELSSFDIKIVDETGKVFATVNNYLMKRAGANQTKQFFEMADPSLHTMDWVKDTTSFKTTSSDNDGKAAVVVRTIDDCNEKLIEEVRNTVNANVYELIVCDWKMKDTARKRYIAPDDYKHICSIFDEFEMTGLDQVIFLPQDHRNVDSADVLEEKIEGMLHAFYNVTKALASNKRLGSIRVSMMTKITGKEIDPMAMALQGMGKSLLNEYGRLKLKCVFYSVETSLKNVAKELLNSRNDYLVYWKADECYVPGIKELPVSEETSSEEKFVLKKGGTYIITGGLGGIGFVLANYLANLESDIRLVLMSRRNLSPKENWVNETDDIYKRLCELDNKVKDLSYYSCDVADEKSVKKIAEELNDVKGIIHAAGVAGGGFIIKKGWDAFYDVLKPKMQGTVNMLNVGRKFETDFIVMFSSYSSILPVAGQSDYISANSFIDAMSYGNDLGLPVKVINWGGWKECGMAFDNKVDMNNSPVEFLSNEEGARMFKEAMESEVSQVLVGKLNCDAIADVTEDFNKVIRFPEYIVEKLKRGHGKAKNQREVYNVTVTGKETPLTETETKVSQVWAKVLGLEEIDYQDKFLEIGGDSLSATYLQKELELSYPNVMDITDVFIYSSIKDMSDFIDSKVQPVRKEEHIESKEEEYIESEQSSVEEKKPENDNQNKKSNDDLSEMLKMLESGEIDLKEAVKYI